MKRSWSDPAPGPSRELDTVFDPDFDQKNRRANASVSDTVANLAQRAERVPGQVQRFEVASDRLEHSFTGRLLAPGKLPQSCQ